MVNLTNSELAEITTESLPPASIDALKTLRNQMCESTQQSGFKLQSQQRFLRRVLSPDAPTRNLLMIHGTGTGKCHGVDTPILMHDGSVKLVQDIQVDDLLMGDDSSPRRVLSLARGRDTLYSVTSVKGDSYVVNSEHILCLQHTSTRKEITEIEVRDFLKLSKKLQRNLKGYRVPVEFESREVDFDPYVLGVWLGDGSQRDPVISSQDAVILKYLRTFCQENNAVLTFQSGYDYRISSISKKFPNVFLEFLKTHNLLNNKHVPASYKINSRDVRLQVLAGLIDTDGYLTSGTYEIIQKSDQLADDITFLARSVGLHVSRKPVQKSCVYKGERIVGTYHRMFLSGDVDMIPVKLLRKQSQPRRQIKDALRYGITVTSVGEGDYYGFTLDGNNRYLLGDFTVTHNTCTAIQVAEEYILRPEFQDRKVFVVASAAVQDNFQSQLFDMTRVSIDTLAGTLESKQCTGRRYLDMLMRIESEPKNWNNPEIRAKLERTANAIIKEFYEFTAYSSFGNLILSKLGGTEKDIDRAWVHENFDNRLLIIDEAHNIRESKDEEGMKGVTRALENLVKVADGLVLVLLTATPMYDTYDEMAYYVNLFLWNDRKQLPTESVKTADFFNPDGTLKAGPGGERFRKWCQDYVSFVKGENPFTFPFRLPPPKVVSRDAITTSFLGKPIPPAERIQYLALVESEVAGVQRGLLMGTEGADDEDKKKVLMQATLAVPPGNKSFNELFRSTAKQYKYTGEPFLTPDELPKHAAKFVTILKAIEAGSGICLVYSNFVALGARLFSMALEEHGYVPYTGSTLLATPSHRGSVKGKYILLTSDITEAEISKLLDAVKRPNNRDGSQIRVVVAGPIVSEGVDFRYMRQIHVMDPWWNMSRIEQVVGRGLRTCSHQVLPFEEQNCSVYFHVVRTGSGTECFDEYTYRTKVEQKALKIARVRKVLAESAMDCPLQNQINTLPEDWKNLEVEQIQSEGRTPVTYRLRGMLAPTFDDVPDVAACIVTPSIEDPTHVRPLSTYLDVRDELLEKLARLLANKPVWNRTDLIAALKPYTEEVVIFNIQQAVTSGFRFKDSFGRASVLESRGDLYALAPLGVANNTLVERTTQPPVRGAVELPEAEAKEEEEAEVADDILDLKREEYEFPADATTRFTPEILNGYIFDHVLTDSEKRAYLKTHPTTLPFAKRLYVEGTDYVVLGKDTFEPPEPPIGEDLSAYKAWNTALLNTFIENKTSLFASLKNGKLTISKMTIDGTTPTRKLEKGGKKFEPIVCDTGENTTSTMNTFAKYIDAKGVGLPTVQAPGKAAKPMTGPQRCVYIELLAREENNCVWVTPEELSVLYDGKAAKGQTPTNQDIFTEAFRK
jgi:hypothetical protein